MPVNVSIRNINPAPPPPPPPPPVGLNLPRHGVSNGFNILVQTTAAMQAEIDFCADVGAKLIRLDLLDAASYQTAFGICLARAELKGLKTIAVLRGTSTPTTTTYTQDYCTRMWNAWGTRIACWEWVNEPNLGSSSGLSRYTPAQYATELIVFYNTIKSFSATAICVNGGLGVWAGSGPSYPANWWPGVLTNGGRGHFDALNQHFYGATSNAQWTDGLAMDSDGKPTIVTESGESLANVSEATQASIIQAGQADLRVPVICTYTMMPTTDANFSMRRPDGTARPAYTAYQAGA